MSKDSFFYGNGRDILYWLCHFRVVVDLVFAEVVVAVVMMMVVLVVVEQYFFFNDSDDLCQY